MEILMSMYVNYMSILLCSLTKRLLSPESLRSLSNLVSFASKRKVSRMNANIFVSERKVYWESEFFSPIFPPQHHMPLGALYEIGKILLLNYQQ